jgi:hypothetical protein
VHTFLFLGGEKIMFENIGDKIKGIALVEFVVGVVFALALGIIIMLLGEIFILIGFLFIFLFSFLAYISSAMIYGFGELIEKSRRIEYRLERNAQNPNASGKLPMEKIAKLYSNGYITEEEYRQALK